MESAKPDKQEETLNAMHAERKDTSDETADRLDIKTEDPEDHHHHENWLAIWKK